LFFWEAIVTALLSHLSASELESRYKAAADPVSKSHFHAIWLLSLAYDIAEVARLLSFSARWVRKLIARYNEGGPECLGDRRIHNGMKPLILTPDALCALKERLKTPPDDGGLWTGPKVARWLAQFHSLKSVHAQRGWDALIAIDYSIQHPRPRHVQAATQEDRAALDQPAFKWLHLNADKLIDNKRLGHFARVSSSAKCPKKTRRRCS
jgi:Winged helix-turn helix